MDLMTYIVKYLNYIDFIMIKTFANKFRNADEAFQYWYQCIEHYGADFAGTKALFNIGFEMDMPGENHIKSSWRKWKHNYAEAEWQWYLSGDNNINNEHSTSAVPLSVWGETASKNYIAGSMEARL